MIKLPSIRFLWTEFKIKNLKLKIRRNYLGSLTIVILGICFSAFFILHSSSFIAPRAEAQQSENNTTVFSGQIIPAFLGGAYDPTEAFKKLAGLPIYVFAYDRWGAGAGWIINNYAVRTQIRADGSFQIQGLPTAAHYGVYFPFGLEDPSNPASNVIRTDGITEEPQTAEFRWPIDTDKIRDVFAYAQGPNPADINDDVGENIKDQFGNDISISGQHEKVFLTSTTTLDIENHINVFPVVPHTVLRIAVYPASVEAPSFEVYAQRVAHDWTPLNRLDLTLVMPSNFPVIKGRTSVAVSSRQPGTPDTTGVFQAYAPKGYYAITIWRAETGSISYKEWNGTNPVNSTYSGLGFLTVHRDWQEILNRINIDPTNDYPIFPMQNRVMVWGLTTDEKGTVQTEDNSDPITGNEVHDLSINIKTDSNVEYSPKFKNNDDFYTGGIMGPGTDRTWKGFYALYQVYSEQNPPLNEHNWVYINGYYPKSGICYDNSPPNAAGYCDGVYKENPASPPRIIKGTDGPVRIDLTASKTDEPDKYPLGYKTGLHILVARPNPSAGDPPIPLRTASAHIIPLEKEVQKRLPAVHKTYGADALGHIYIPDVDLVRGIKYLVEITAGHRYKLAIVPEEKDPVYDGYYFLNATDLTLASNLSSPTYKILGIIPVPFAQANNDGIHFSTEGIIYLPTNAKLVSAQVFVRNYAAGITKQECKEQLDPANATCKVDPYPLVQPLVKAEDNKFTVTFERPPTTEEKDTDFEYLNEANAYLPDYIGDTLGEGADTYEILVEATIETGEGETKSYSGNEPITIDPDGNVTPPVFHLFLNVDCNALKESCGVIDPECGINNFVKVESCNIQKWIAERMESLFGTVKNVVLKTEPITEEKGVIAVWNVMRTITNVLFILILIVIGFMTIFRVNPKEFQPGSALSHVFVAIILSNFSLLIIQFIIDINNVMTEYILSLALNILKTTLPPGAGIIGAGVGGAAIFTSMATMIASMIIGLLSFTTATGGLTLIPILLIGLGIVFAIFLFIFTLIGIFFIRYAVLWLCTILAPLVFVIGAIPTKVTKGLQTLWFETVIPFTLMQTFTAIFLSVGLFLITIGGDENSLFGGFGVALVAGITLMLTFKVPNFVISAFKGAIGGRALGEMPGAISKWTGAQKKEGLERAEDKAYMQTKYDKMKAAGVSTPGRFARAISGPASLETSRSKGVKEGAASGKRETRKDLGLSSNDELDAINYHMEASPQAYDQNAQYLYKTKSGSTRSGTLNEIRGHYKERGVNESVAAIRAIRSASDSPAARASVQKHNAKLQAAGKPTRIKTFQDLREQGSKLVRFGG